MIRVQSDPFDPSTEAAAFQARNRSAGALATFTGCVRPQAADGDVEALELEHYPGFTEARILEIETEAKTRFDVLDTLVIHRFGRMAPGEAIVFVAAASAHRREALTAVDYLMDRLKTDAPFWKKEIRGSSSVWIEPRTEDRLARRRWEKEASS